MPAAYRDSEWRCRHTLACRNRRDGDCIRWAESAINRAKTSFLCWPSAHRWWPRATSFDNLSHGFPAAYTAQPAQNRAWLQGTKAAKHASRWPLIAAHNVATDRWFDSNNSRLNAELNSGNRLSTPLSHRDWDDIWCCCFPTNAYRSQAICWHTARTYQAEIAQYRLSGPWVHRLFPWLLAAYKPAKALVVPTKTISSPAHCVLFPPPSAHRQWPNRRWNAGIRWQSVHI